MSDPKKVALFVDIENVYLGLRNTYNRELSPELLVAKAKARGELAKAFAYADWKELPEGLADKLKPFGFETAQVERLAHSREPSGKRREVVRDLVPLELSLGLVKTLKEDASIEVCVLCTGDRAFASAVKLARESFGKEVVVAAIPGSLAKELEVVASAVDPIEVPPLEPVDEEGLSKLVPLMEELERRKRYLNFKYIRESVVRHGELKAKTFDEAERLLSDAIACGLVLKQKVEDKYHPGQLFTAYALNRDSALWKKYGSGLPAPVRVDGEDGPVGEPAPNAPTLAGDPLPESAAASASPAAPEPSPSGLEPLAPAAPSSLGSLPAMPTFGGGSAPAPAAAGAPGEPGEPRERRSRRGRRGGRPDRSDRPEAARAERSDDRALEPARGGGDRGDRGDRGRDRGDRGDRGRSRDGRDGGRSNGRDRGGDRGRDRGQRSSQGGGRDFNRRAPSPTGSSRWDPSGSRRDPNAPALNDDEIDEERILRARGDL